MSASVVNGSFPLWALLPKRETTAQSFIEKYPDYDGRGIKIAIIDSGVDPGADGLQLTSDGKPKIVDMMDATGAGDVDTSTVVEADEQGFITGLTATKLKIPDHWVNPSGTYHIGLKNIYQLYPCYVGTRMTREYRDTQWEPTHQTIKTETLRALREFEGKHGDPSRDTFDEKLLREDLQSRVDFLEDMESNHKYQDLGPTYDSSHGTHVASIAAANFPTDPHRNGVAPGAQIVSICFDDNRYAQGFDSSFVRALIKVIETGCHVINMSYVRTTQYFDDTVYDFMSEVVNKYGILFVICAGNEGPSLSTVWLNTVYSASFISVGAYVSPDMMTTAYSMTKQIHGLMYEWTSRGPTLLGDLGVTVCAPGGAITSVAACDLMRAELANGTSMSAPNCAGCLCLLLSGLQALNIEYSPYSVRRAIENTALVLPDSEPFTHGHGLIQVEKAFEHLTRFKGAMEMDVRFNVTCGQGLGVYLREAVDVVNPTLYDIKIEPFFLNHKRIGI
ncbi:unnamed protein product [Oppiella nova]|uniref:Peptidase S8/S53 domain-containing protein n=1 Tax=Oppiella nova TaxID=334625 RepID=A0A7R9MAP8_9ACAR|nr:unnamed protein product [Oppiella nova]CAG2173729.1 unnamed protein product [Oppiella nova]